LILFHFQLLLPLPLSPLYDFLIFQAAGADAPLPRRDASRVSRADFATGRLILHASLATPPHLRHAAEFLSAARPLPPHVAAALRSRGFSALFRYVL
jgi:hypothetical protein